MRIFFRGGKAESRLNFDLSPIELLKWDPITMRVQERNASVNHYLNRIEQKFQDFLIIEATNLQNFTPSEIRDELTGTKKKNIPLLMDFIDKFFEEYVLNNPNKAEGTTKNYRRAINHMKSFLQYHKLRSLTIDNFSYDKAVAFKNFLLNKNLEIDRSGMTEVSALGIIKKFRTIFNEAVECDLISRNPFKKIKLSAKSPQKQRLSADQVWKIYKLDLQFWPYLDIYRDFFMFSAITGISYSDTVALEWRHFEIRDEGLVKLFINRKKTGTATELFLPELAWKILGKYRKSEGIACEKVFPFRSNQALNNQLKLLAQIAGIQFKITCHTARHSYRQLIGEAGIADDAVIKKLMGHVRRDIDSIYYQLPEKNLIEAKIKIDNLLDRFL